MSFGWILIAVLGIVGLLCLLCIPHNLRIWRARRVYRALPNEIKDQTLHLIEEAAKDGPSVTFLRLDEEHAGEPRQFLLESHVGGVPYAEVGDTWPIGTPEGDPAKFLLQIRLDEPSLGGKWQGRLLTFFLVFDRAQVVRSYETPSLEKFVPLTPPKPPDPLRPSIRLTPIRTPVETTGERVPSPPRRLCETIPAIPQLLTRFTNDCSGLLTQILRPNIYSYDLDHWQMAYVGGDPLLIQEPHDPKCDECGQLMRFLFMFGEIIPGLQIADAGVCCVYGCDEHPHRCKGFVDSH